MKMTIAMIVTAEYKGEKAAYIAELGVKDDVVAPTFQVAGHWKVMERWNPLYSDAAFRKCGGWELLDAVFDNRVNSALCLVNNMKLSNLKYRLDNIGRVDLTGFNYKSGLKVNSELLVKVV